MDTLSNTECGLRRLIIAEIDLLLFELNKQGEVNIADSTCFQVVFSSKLNNKYEMLVRLFKDLGNFNYVETVASTPYSIIISNHQLVFKLADTKRGIETFKKETNRNCKLG